jgi:magnesium transporter
MSRYGFIRAVASSSKVQITPRSISHIPPEGASRSQCRTFLTKRSKSFWSPSYPPPDHAESPQVPFTPPRPSSDHFPIVAAGPDAKSAPHILYADSEEPMTKTRDRKQRYLDSLMDRAGELSLRCEYN